MAMEWFWPDILIQMLIGIVSTILVNQLPTWRKRLFEILSESFTAYFKRQLIEVVAKRDRFKSIPSILLLILLFVWLTFTNELNQTEKTVISIGDEINEIRVHNDTVSNRIKRGGNPFEENEGNVGPDSPHNYETNKNTATILNNPNEIEATYAKFQKAKNTYYFVKTFFYFLFFLGLFKTWLMIERNAMIIEIEWLLNRCRTVLSQRDVNSLEKDSLEMKSYRDYKGLVEKMEEELQKELSKSTAASTSI